MARKPAKPSAKTLSREELHALVWSMPMTAAAAEVGLSPTGLAKICDRMLIPYPTRGHWTKPAAEQPAPTPLPPAPALDQAVTIAGERAASRRARTRLTPEAREAQMLDAARRIVAEEGAAAASMKRVAREIGVSETLAFTYFKSRAALLAAVARRELAEMEAIRRANIARGDTRRSQIALSTSAYLEQIELRGSVLHVLLAAPEVRALLRPEHRAQQKRGGDRTAETFADRYGVSRDVAHASTQALTATSRRAGHLLAKGRLSRAATQRLLMTMMERANRDIVAAAKPPRAARPSARAKS